MSLAILNPQEEINHNQPTLNHSQPRRQIIKKKVIAIGKMSKHLAVLRENPRLVNELKSLNGGKLPLGVLTNGEQGLIDAIAKFKAGTMTLKQHRTDDEGVDQKDRSLQHIHATPNTKVAREGQV